MKMRRLTLKVQFRLQGQILGLKMTLSANLRIFIGTLRLGFSTTNAFCQNVKPPKDRFLSKDMKIAAEMIRDGSIWNCVKEHVMAYED